MESHTVLSNNQFFYITSQKEKLSKEFNKSQDLKRLEKKIEKCFKEFDLIIQSAELSQEYKDRLFSLSRINQFLTKLTEYEPSNPIELEQVKQDIAGRLIDLGVRYFESRYHEYQFILKHVTEFQGLVHNLRTLAKVNKIESEGIDLYRARRRQKIPPKIEMDSKNYTARCMICWNYATDHNKMNAMKKIRHEKGCTVDKKDLERCISVIAPVAAKDIVKSNMK